LWVSTSDYLSILYMFKVFPYPDHID